MPLGTFKSALMGAAAGGGFSATGGTITTSGDYTIHTFTSSGNFVVAGSADVEYMVIAGGGGGGNSYGYSGGGGAGGYRTATGFSVTAQTYAITIGAGGSQGSDGNNSVFSTITSTGGGSGGGTSGAGSDGGSGGGAGNQSTSYGAGNDGSYSPVEGYRGAVGQGSASDGLGNFRYFGGGGGGSSEYGGSNNEGAGQNAPLYSGAKRDLGGDGTANSITGSSVTYAAGGSANGWLPHRGWPEGGSSADTTDNTGDGGGGGDNHNGGGSGIVIIKYATA